ncbi:hypothetical protein ACS0TY_030563 [Phlomoides rotata]
MTPIQFLRELEKRLWVKQRIHITACHLCSAIYYKLRNLGNSIPIKHLTKGMSGTGSLLDAVQLAETLGTPGVRNPQVRVLWGTIKHIRQGSKGISLLHSSGRSKVPSDVQHAVSRSDTHARKLSLYTSAGQKAVGEGRGHWNSPTPNNIELGKFGSGQDPKNKEHSTTSLSKEHGLATELGYSFPIGDPWIIDGIFQWPFASESVLPSQCPSIYPMHSFRSCTRLFRIGYTSLFAVHRTRRQSRQRKCKYKQLHL